MGGQLDVGCYTVALRRVHPKLLHVSQVWSRVPEVPGSQETGAGGLSPALQAGPGQHFEILAHNTTQHNTALRWEAEQEDPKVESSLGHLGT